MVVIGTAASDQARARSCMSTQRTLLAVPKMDCPSEERMIRMALDGLPELVDLQFDLGQRKLTMFHTGDAGPLIARLERLGLGARLESSVEAGPGDLPAGQRKGSEAGVLRV